MSWPEAVAISIGAICFASLLMSKWPWERDITYTCDCQCKGCAGEDEDEET